VGVEAAAANIGVTVILEKADHACDTIVSLYREGKRVDAVYRKVAVAPQGSLSFDTMTRESFLAWMEEVITDYGLDVRYGHEVLEIIKEKNGFRITDSSGSVIEASVVAIAIGIFGKPVKPSYRIPREVRERIFFSIPDMPPAGQNILVVGGGDSAAEAACFLSRENRVTLSYRRKEFFRVNEPNLCTLNQCCNFANLQTKLGVDILGVGQAEKQVKVSFADDREELYDAVFYFLGGITPRAFLEKAGIRYRNNKPVVDKHGETNVPGLFLAGDLVAEKGTIMQAFNSAAIVVKKISLQHGRQRS